MEGNLVCRLCLYNNEDIVSIFGESQREAKLHEKLLQYLNLDVKEDDTLPKLICMKCFQTVENFHLFYQEVAQNQTVFAYSSQPGMIVISDQNSHTTYILREEEIGQQSCIDISNDLQQYGGPSSSSTGSETGHQKVTLVQLPNHQVTATVLGTVDTSGGIMLSTGGDENGSLGILNSELPTYDEAQKCKEQQQAASVMKEELDIKIVVDEPEEEGRLDDVLDFQQSLRSVQNDEEHKFDRSPEQSSMQEMLNDGDFNVDEDEDDVDDDDDDDDNALEEDHKNESLTGETRAPSVLDFKVFPQKLIQSNRLIVRGKYLSMLIASFYDLSCDLCSENREDGSYKFSTLESFVNHFKDEHDANGYVWCCNQRIAKPRMMALHMARHLQPEAFKCPECGKSMTTPKILQYHIQNHRPEEERPLKCNLCPRRFSYGSALVSHNQSHLPEVERTRNVCDECGRSYSSAKTLAEHVTARHTKMEPLAYVCHICAKRFTSKSNLGYHLTTHQPKIHQVQCDQCNKWLKNKLCLRKHMVQHSMVRHKCNLCDYSALNMQCLKNHMRVQHTNLKPFACDVCGKSFKLKNTLLNHEVQHTGLKKFSCEFCARTFASSGNYYAHRKRMHPQELAVQKKRKEEEENEFRKKTLLAESK